MLRKPDIVKLAAKRDFRGLRKAVAYREGLAKHRPTRLAAARALAELGDAEGLVAALRPNEPEVELAAVEGLARIGDERAVHALVTAVLTHPLYLDREGREVALAAIRALSALGPEAVDGVVGALRVATDPDAALYYAGAIERLEQRWFRDAPTLLVGAAAAALGEIEWEPAAEPLARLEPALGDEAVAERRWTQMRSVATGTAFLFDLPDADRARAQRADDLAYAHKRVKHALERIQAAHPAAEGAAGAEIRRLLVLVPQPPAAGEQRLIDELLDSLRSNDGRPYRACLVEGAKVRLAVVGAAEFDDTLITATALQAWGEEAMRGALSHQRFSHPGGRGAVAALWS